MIVIMYYDTLLSKISFSPQRRKGRREVFFCLAVRGRQTKSLPSSYDRTTEGRDGYKEISILPRRDAVSDPIAVSRLRGRSHFVAAKARLHQKKNLPLRSLRLCGEPDFQRGQRESKSPMKSTQAPTTFI